MEEIAKAIREGQTDAIKAKPAKKQEKEFDILGDHLTKRFNTPVAFAYGKNGSGKITFSFKNESELERLIAIFDGVKSGNA